MDNLINVKLEDGTEVKVRKGITLKELSEQYYKKNKAPIMIAVVNGKLQELREEVNKDSEIVFVDLSNQDGLRVYKRSVCLLLLKVLDEMYSSDEIKKVIIKHSLNKGYYIEINGNIKLVENDLFSIENKMKELVSRDIEIKKSSISLEHAMNFFKDKGMYDKYKLFKYRRVSTVNLYELEGYKNYFYGYMVSSTGCLKNFKLHLYKEGFILQFPTVESPNELIPYKPFNKLFKIYKESKKWSKIMEVDTVGALNDAISQGKIGELISVSEALHEKKIAAIADKIAENRDKIKIILIAGPSSSGKTTFAHRLSVQLKVNGMKPHPISLDDYFVNRELTPIDEEGKYDFESIHALDIRQFNEDLVTLLNGVVVEIPSFNFKTGQREYKGNYIQLEKNDVLVVEGIHGLNELLTRSISKENKFKIYISALTQLNIDDHNRIPTTDGRLLRRIVRDNQYRGTTADKTIEMWKSVRRGEEKNIFPYQEEADVMFNSAHIYELAILKQYAEPLLFNINKYQPQYFEAKRLIKFLDYFLGVSGEDVPNNSIIREFIGGSCFRK